MARSVRTCWPPDRGWPCLQGLFRGKPSFSAPLTQTSDLYSRGDKSFDAPAPRGVLRAVFLEAVGAQRGARAAGGGCGRRSGGDQPCASGATWPHAQALNTLCAGGRAREREQLWARDREVCSRGSGTRTAGVLYLCE